MPNLSIRNLDVTAYAELKQRAEQEDASINTLVLRLIDEGLGRKPAKPAQRRHGDLDSLAGSWSAAEAADFDRATAPFGEVDARLWK